MKRPRRKPMDPKLYGRRFARAGGVLYLNGADWLDVHNRAGRTPEQTAAMSRYVMAHEFDALRDAIRAEQLAELTAAGWRPPPPPAARPEKRNRKPQPPAGRRQKRTHSNGRR